MSKTNPFDFVDSINFSKKDLMRGTENDTLAEKSYNAWVINSALSYFPDTVHYANMMNGNPHLDNRMQYCYLINTVRSKKRYSKWVKKKEDGDLEAIARFYGYSMKKARSAIQILSAEQLQQIREFDKGG
jgi:hypothetical protein